MPRRKQFYLRASRSADYRYKRYETPFPNVASQQGVDLLHRCHQFATAAKTSPCIGATNCGEHGGANSVSGYISDCYDKFSIWQALPVVVVSARLVRRPVPSSDFKT